ncbi:PE-PPE domain-containing protein [Mycobacterium sp. pUA109]|uniref:PE-PPE domain-containing protein n=1 Tax=Mycobacterium sp. pUA109 TaxID=3238982 RepID=UPI00351BCC18
MLRRRLFSLVVAVLAVVSATVLSLTSAFESTIRTVMAEAALLADDSLVMGGSGLPIPPDSYVTGLTNTFITPNFPGFTSDTAYGLVTPEGLYPLTGIKSLPLDTSVQQGLTILNNAIMNPPDATSPGYAGNDLVVLGYSQSAVISSLEMDQLANTPGAPSADDLHFVLLGDPMNPNGGLLERFAGLDLPSLGLNFYGATPDSTIYPTDIYTLEYDGYADFPRYPLNLLSDLNAFAGIEYVHGTYPDLTAAQIAPVTDGGEAILLPGSAELTGEGATNYWMIPTENLPLLNPVRDIPLIGKPIADLLQPDLTALVNLGYGDPDYGWSTAPANVATQFGLFPSLSDFEKLPGLLVSGTQQGIEAFVKDISGGLSGLSLSSLTNPLAALDTGSAVAAASDPLGMLSNVVNALTSAAASGYATLLPTADILNALVTSIPLYDATLFVDAVSSGDLLGAIGDPIAADVGLGTMAGGFELMVVVDALQSVVGDLTSIIPF